MSAQDEAERAQWWADRLRWEADHMDAWAALERAKGRPEGDLTWGNCVKETGVLTEDGKHIDPRRGTLVPLPGQAVN